MKQLFNLSTADRRTLVRGAIAIACIIVVGRGVPALRKIEQQREAEWRESSTQLATLRAVSRGERSIRDSLRVRSERLAQLRTLLIHAASPQLASAELAETLAEYAVANGARVSATVLRQDSAFTRDIARVGARMNLSTDVQGLAAILARIESDPRRFSVNELSVSNADPGGADTRAELLTVDFFVETLAVRADFVRAAGVK